VVTNQKTEVKQKTYRSRWQKTFKQKSNRTHIGAGDNKLKNRLDMMICLLYSSPWSRFKLTTSVV